MELDESEAQFVSAIDKHGWHVMRVLSGDDGSPEFAYTTGLWRRFGHPELLIVGVPLDNAMSILNGMGTDIRDGVRRFESGGPVQDVVDGFGVYFTEVEWKHFGEYFGWSLWYYGTYLGKREQFPVLQCIWPAKGNGTYPWDREWPNDLKDWQPVLGDRPATKH